MRLRRGLTVLWRRTGEMQIGHGPTQRLILTELPPDIEELIWSLGHAQTAARFRRKAQARGMAPEAITDLTARLHSAKVLAVERDNRISVRLPPTARRRLAPDAAAWSLVREDASGWAMLTARAGRRVAVRGLDRTGVSIAIRLAAAGIGHLQLIDDGTVAATDTGHGGYRPADRGQPRLTAAARLIRDAAPEIVIAGQLSEADLVISIESCVHDPVVAAQLLRGDIHHLPVLLRETDAVIGPWIRPGKGPCLRCLHLRHVEQDACWPAVATQLAALRTASPIVESSLRDLVVAHTVAQVLAIVDDRSPALAGATMQLALPDIVPHLHRWSAHPNCGCADLPVAGG